MAINTATATVPWYDLAADLAFQLATNKDVLEGGPFTFLDPNRRRYYEAYNAVYGLSGACMQSVRRQAGLPVFDFNEEIDLDVGTPPDRAFRAAFLIEKACGHHNPACRSIDLRWLKAEYGVELGDVVACLQRAAKEGIRCPIQPSLTPSDSGAQEDVGSAADTGAEDGACLSDGHSGESNTVPDIRRLAETETDLDPEVAAGARGTPEKPNHPDIQTPSGSVMINAAQVSISADSVVVDGPSVGSPTRGKRGKEKWPRAQEKMLKILGQDELPKSMRAAADLIKESVSTTRRAALKSTLLREHFNFRATENETMLSDDNLLATLAKQADSRTKAFLRRLSRDQENDLERRLRQMEPEDQVKLLKTLAVDPDAGRAADVQYIENADQDSRADDPDS